MPHDMIIPYLHLPYFHVSNNALFSIQYFSTLILYRRSLNTFYQQNKISHPEDNMIARSSYHSNGRSITDVTVFLWQAICIWVHTSVVLYLFYVIIMVAIPGGLAS